MLTLNQLIGTSTIEASFTSTLVLAFAILSLVLASVGLYGVLAYLVEFFNSTGWAFLGQVAVPLRLPDAGRLAGSNSPEAGFWTTASPCGQWQSNCVTRFTDFNSAKV